MKQLLNVGNAVDDSTGDYMREGGLKINSNFDDIYYQLGDGDNPHPAGAYKTISTQSNGNVVDVRFGGSYAVDTSNGQMQIKLPKGSVAKYNQRIKICDPFSTWQTNAVTIVPAVGDTIKGDASSRSFSTNLTDLTLVYCAPGRWEYVPNQQINKVSNGDVSTVARREFIATAGQTDFMDIFNGTQFNLTNTQVYRRGNLLYYGDVFSDDSDYGSIANGQIAPLDGINIRLREPCEEGDALIVVSYMDGIAQFRSTYNRLDTVLIDVNETNDVSVVGSKLVADLKTLNEITFAQLGYVMSSNTGLINPNTLEVYVNGVILNEAGTAGLPMFICDGVPTATNRDDCVAQNGSWNESNTDYSVVEDDRDALIALKFDRKFENGDVITIKWFNNDIGTTMTIDEITNVTDDRYVSQGQDVHLSGTIRVTDFNKPAWPNVEYNGNTIVRVATPSDMFDLTYPIGHIIENGLNPNNPATYMGFGQWVLFGEKRMTVGWTPDQQDTLFHLNNNDLDGSGNPSATAGGTGGVRQITLDNNNLPRTETDEKVLIVDANGTIVVGGCQFDPDEEGPAYDKYREAKAVTNATHTPPSPFTTLSPYITVYRWMRVA